MEGGPSPSFCPGGRPRLDMDGVPAQGPHLLPGLAELGGRRARALVRRGSVPCPVRDAELRWFQRPPPSRSTSRMAERTRVRQPLAASAGPTTSPTGGCACVEILMGAASRPSSLVSGSTAAGAHSGSGQPARRVRPQAGQDGRSPSHPSGRSQPGHRRAVRLSPVTRSRRPSGTRPLC